MQTKWSKCISFTRLSYNQHTKIEIFNAPNIWKESLIAPGLKEMTSARTQNKGALTCLETGDELNRQPLKSPTNMGPKVKHLQTPWLHQPPPFYKETSSPDASLPIASWKKRHWRLLVVSSTVRWWEVFSSWNITTPQKDTTNVWSQGHIDMKQVRIEPTNVFPCISSIDVTQVFHLSCPVILRILAPKACEQ